MDNLNKFIEHTLLKQDAKKEDLIKLFAEANEHLDRQKIMPSSSLRPMLCP